MITAAPAEEKTASFERDAWRSWDRHEAPARTVTVTVTAEHVSQAYWARFRDPVSLAIRPLLNERSTVQMYWNSDSWAPMGAYDDARIGIHIEPERPEEGDEEEGAHWLPLPRRATAAMWKLRSKGSAQYTPVTIKLTLPAAALKGSPEGSDTEDTA